MAASAKTLAHDKPNPAEDWTVVLPRRGKQKRNFHKVIIHEPKKQEEVWTPADIETNPERESKLMQKMQNCIKKLESSSFWLTFSDQLQTPEILDQFLKAVCSEGKMPMVIYGIGSIESYEPPRLQLSLAILMKRMFNWIGEVEVFDPVISLAESKVLAALGCSVLTVNEQGRRQTLKPMMFFMPHCEAELYDNLLEANWRPDLLDNIILFGNSFEAYEQHWSVCKNLTLADSRKHILAIRQFVKEHAIDSFSDDFFRAFHGSSWHFFNIDPHTDLCDAKL
ncbi:protein SENSITIVITY TO RED LIGHT REDUCED 1-like [Nicotiana tabacum]|uniref:Protein SENSITIVITY TO RED LIGHT REDUCED 1-like n=2 Tax=Nicotiana tabacum TaxID=4097 RepID=A0A1S3XPS4_TOBAC|nr:PREDICTED: protein SENSITIVITY TO RED LIGHT REDUCED 1-like [Nicotiana tabacum]XP_016441656.1 PREDICTED: protein SENSITIVITY TO RED LIGHT REDUCED 1-like [Nicotiana tabacum]XP_016441657.1 PREDICTED: protein SENSITIVITY TO RED LIGHT REDUCED 1-like [Nicotiana tabacum]